MKLWQLIWRRHRLAFTGIIVLNLINAGVNVGVIAYISRHLIDQKQQNWSTLGEFLLGIMLLLITTFISQYGLTRLGHQFVLTMRAELLKRIMDTPLAQKEALGHARLQASLAHDVQAITVAFVRLPEWVQGVIVCSGAALYLAWLSWPLLLVLGVWVGLTVWGSSYLVRQVYAHLTQVRGFTDKLHQDYETAIAGGKELMLNQHRAQQVFSQFLTHAQGYRDKVIQADTCHLSALSWTNIMMFAAIGVVYACANGEHWVNNSVATTFALTVLFLQSPLLKAVGAYPVLKSAQIALEKIQSLQLGPYQPEFRQETWSDAWQELSFENIGYGYQEKPLTALRRPESLKEVPFAAPQGFALKDITFTLYRGETVFLIGANGSGKSTLAKLLTGLYAPDTGRIVVDGQTISSENEVAYRQLFSSVYSDFYLFDALQGKEGATPDAALLGEWLDKLELTDKLELEGATVNGPKLSQGQKKRMALLLAVLEQKSFLLLDEWAADQDPSFRRIFYQTMIPHLKSMGKTLFVISHDDRYFGHADRLFEMRAGRLTELTGQARHKATQDAIGHLNHP